MRSGSMRTAPLAGQFVRLAAGAGAGLVRWSISANGMPIVTGITARRQETTLARIERSSEELQKLSCQPTGSRLRCRASDYEVRFNDHMTHRIRSAIGQHPQQ